MKRAPISKRDLVFAILAPVAWVSCIRTFSRLPDEAIEGLMIALIYLSFAFCRVVSRLWWWFQFWKQSSM